MNVSVIIPIYGAAAVLDECLDRLARQTYPRADFEVIVVDNGAPDLAAVLAHHPDVRVVSEARPGSYAARNAGLRIARGAILAFTDADCLPHSDWLAVGVDSLGRSDATGVVAGAIEIVAPRPAHISPTAYLYNALFSFRGDGFRRAGGFGATANLIVRRAVLDAVGPFDARFLSAGDMEWGRRAKRGGFPTRYVRELRVGHQVRSVRATLARAVRLAGGNQTSAEISHPTDSGRRLLGSVKDEVWHHTRWAWSELRSPEIAADAGLRARVGALVLAVQVLRAAERVRVHCGGAPRRA